MKRFLSLAALIALVSCSREGAAPPSPAAATACLNLAKVETGSRVIAALPTDSGMHALWDPQSFRSVCSFETWEDAILKNDGIRKAISVGAFVPIYVHSDGSPLIDLRIGTRDKPSVFGDVPNGKITRQSRPFLFVSQGHVALSGIEYIGGTTDASTRVLPLRPGRWSVVTAEVETREGVSEKDGETVPNFIVLINPEIAPETVYGQTEETFE